MSVGHIPNNLRQYRKQVGLRQTDVADILGLQCADRLSHWENGTAVPSMVNLFKLAAIYKVAPQELYADLVRTIGEAVSEKPSSTT